MLEVVVCGHRNLEGTSLLYVLGVLDFSEDERAVRIGTPFSSAGLEHEYSVLTVFLKEIDWCQVLWLEETCSFDIDELFVSLEVFRELNLDIAFVVERSLHGYSDTERAILTNTTRIIEYELNIVECCRLRHSRQRYAL